MAWRLARILWFSGDFCHSRYRACHHVCDFSINADKVQLTGNKADTKTYYRHSGYNGGLKAESFRQAMEKHPEKVIERAVRGMLPKTTLGRAQMTKLKVYAGAEHPHAAQNPTKIELEA